MQTEPKVPLQGVQDQFRDTSAVDNQALLVIPSSSDNAATVQPAKRPTRQWAAWTREEEESFFTALRQVGKNFEKITCRVQSKNKDQVRHYYYRLVRRMNKLLGPGLCLDAKNSKDTNAAMLRWWSLLEKYSCKASKLHLKPRRFKIFVEALEHQLLKDRKKNVRKRSFQGESHSSPSPAVFLTQNKSCANDLRAAKIVLGDCQNVQKGGQGKVSSTRRNLNIGVCRSGNKGDSSLAKPSRQRRKNCTLSATAFKRWEKAAMAGVSLVADAAEHLERTTCDKEAGRQMELADLSVQTVACSMEKINSSPSVQVKANLSNMSQNLVLENNVHTTAKLKLQLFPIDEITRKALEADKHNPYLELTLGTRKKISSILDHLDRKWGSSSAASGELMLFPFTIQRENLFGHHQRWTRDSVVTAAEVYAITGSPSIFRLRYGWIMSNELHTIMPDTLVPAEGKNKLVGEQISHCSSGHQISESDNSLVQQPRTAASDSGPQNFVFESLNVAASMWPKRNLTCNVSTARKLANVVDQGIRNISKLSAGDWDCSVTNVSVGDLLTDVSDSRDGNGVKTSRCYGELPSCCDSFDAAIAAHISSQNKTGSSGLPLHLSSFWDAEETCDAFSFRNKAVVNNQAPNSSVTAATDAGEGTARISSGSSGSNVQLHEVVALDTVQDGQMDECPSKPPETGNSAKDISSLTDIYWPDSLGPLELDVPSCKYYSADLIISDSLSGLNRLIASSLDAFQNCSFFGVDEKGPSSANGATGDASFSGTVGTGGDGFALSSGVTSGRP